MMCGVGKWNAKLTLGTANISDTVQCVFQRSSERVLARSEISNRHDIGGFRYCNEAELSDEDSEAAAKQALSRLIWRNRSRLLISSQNS